MSDREEIVLTRKELYDLVWSKPLRNIAEEFGMSDVALGKWCRKMDIPRPGRGYWQKLEVGKKPRRKRLPRPEEKDALHIRLPDPNKVPQEPPREKTPIEVFESDPDNLIRVPAELVQPHVLVIQAEKALKNGRVESRYGWAYPTSQPCLDLLTSPESRSRALRILDALLKALESRGLAVEVTDERTRKSTTFALVDGEKIGFAIFESPKKGLVTDEWSGRQRQGMLPSGQLVLRIRKEYGYDRIQFRDQKRTSLEKRLNEFVITLYQEAADRKAERIKREQQRIEREKQERQREEIQRLRRMEELRIQELHRQADEWAKAQGIRSYVNAAQTLYDSLGASDRAFETWRLWAEQQANNIDPLHFPANQPPPWAPKEPPDVDVRLW